MRTCSFWKRETADEGTGGNPSRILKGSCFLLGLGLWASLLTTARALDSDDQTPPLPKLPSIEFANLTSTVHDALHQSLEEVKARPDNACANGKLGMVLHAHKFLAEAEVCYRRAQLLEPDSFRWTYYLALVQRDQANCKDAEPTFREALRLNSDYVPAKLGVSQCVLVSAKWDEAIEIYQEVLAKNPAIAEAYYGLGRAYASKNDLEYAEEAFRKSLELAPQFGTAHHALARVYQRLRKPDLAQEQLALAEKSEGGLPEIEDPLLAEVEALYRDFNAYLKVAEELGGKGNLPGAVAAYSEALRIKPDLPEAHARLVYLFSRSGETAKAEEHYREAVRLDLENVEAHFNFGVLRMGQRNFLEAEKAFRRAVEINPRYAEARNNLAYLYEGQGRLTEAVAELRQALEVNAEFAQARFSLGRLLVKQENFEDGIPHLVKAAAMASDDYQASYVHALGLAFASVGDIENGLRYLRLARRSAVARHQSELVQSIDDDLRLLGDFPVL